MHAQLVPDTLLRLAFHIQYIYQVQTGALVLYLLLTRTDGLVLSQCGKKERTSRSSLVDLAQVTMLTHDKHRMLSLELVLSVRFLSIGHCSNNGKTEACNDSCVAGALQ